MKHLARFGYASKAIIYAIVGVLAILTSMNLGGRITDPNGALRLVLAQPFGRLLLVVLAVGLCGYATWRVLDALVDPDRHGRDARGLMVRAGNAVRGCIYGALGLDAIRLLRGIGGSGRGDAETWTARLLAFPFGALAVGAIGVAVAIYGLNDLLQSLRGTHDAKLDWSSIDARVRPAIQKISRFGVGVRGGLIATLGIFLVRAALTHNPSEAAGARESMIRLGTLFEGRWFLALIAAGVLAYAVDQAVHARCRRVRPVL